MPHHWHILMKVASEAFRLKLYLKKLTTHHIFHPWVMMCCSQHSHSRTLVLHFGVDWLFWGHKPALQHCFMIGALTTSWCPLYHTLVKAENILTIVNLWWNSPIRIQRPNQYLQNNPPKPLWNPYTAAALFLSCFLHSWAELSQKAAQRPGLPTTLRAAAFGTRWITQSCFQVSLHETGPLMHILKLLRHHYMLISSKTYRLIQQYLAQQLTTAWIWCCR